jgi:Uma2 family endonuclease
VIEVLSPGDATYDKFEFYHSHQVAEIMVVEPLQRRIECWQRGATGYDESAAFDCAKITASELAALLRWP